VKLLPAAILGAAALFALAACDSSTSSSAAAPASSASAARVAASTAPKAPAAAPGTVTPLAACKALAAWENGSSRSVADDASLRQTFQDTSQPLSGDFATWTAGIKSGGADDNANADRVGSDCAAWEVTIFPSASPPPAPATSAPSLAGKTVATFSGSGIENTPKFTVTDTWKLDYTFDCSSFGTSGNFIVNEDGGADFTGASVNELGAGKSGSTYAYGDAGTHYLQVNSECSWSVKVIDEG
jgi:hypothetical protein